MLSDVLPYELPASIDNANFVKLIDRLDLKKNGNYIEANWLGEETSVLLKLLLGSRVQVQRPNAGHRVRITDPKVNLDYPWARALSYNIGTNSGGVRRVSLMHPMSQLAVAEFYKRYADTILYFTNRSRYSIRHPADISRFTIYRDPVFQTDVDDEATGVEETDREYEYMRSYFTYSKCSNMYKFHESAEFRHLERSYGRLVRADITRCFDSIYTHSISWVTNGHELSKEMTRKTDYTFGGKFDKLLQASNDMETHGILVGPELSRIFAEIILQEVDVRVERILSKSNMPLGYEYEIRRFVDDYFIFCNSEVDADKIMSTIGDELKHFKLYLNEAKRVDEKTPLRSALSVAKNQIFRNFRAGISTDSLSEDATTLPPPTASTEQLLLSYKEILLTSDLEHIDLANYALIRLEFEFERTLHKWIVNSRSDQIDRINQKQWSAVARFISNVIDVTISIYAGGVSASHSVKVSRIAHTALKFMDEAKVPHALRKSVQSKIASEIGIHVRRGDSDPTAPMQALILLDSLASMNEHGNVDEQQLRTLLRLGENDAPAPDALAILTALRYCAGREDLGKVRMKIEEVAVQSVKETQKPLDTNSTMLATGLLSSPYVPKSVRKQVLVELGIPSAPLPSRTGSTLFFHWDIADYYHRLQEKRSQEVY